MTTTTTAIYELGVWFINELVSKSAYVYHARASSVFYKTIYLTIYVKMLSSVYFFKYTLLLPFNIVYNKFNLV